MNVTTDELTDTDWPPYRRPRFRLSPARLAAAWLGLAAFNLFLLAAAVVIVLYIVRWIF